MVEWGGGPREPTLHIHAIHACLTWVKADKGPKMDQADQVVRPGTDAGETAWDETLARHVWGKTTRTDDKGRLE